MSITGMIWDTLDIHLHGKTIDHVLVISDRVEP